MLRISELQGDAGNVEHLWERHQVSTDEVEDVLLGIDGEGPDYLVRREAEFSIVPGQTGSRRRLFIVVKHVEFSVFRAFRARDMTAQEARAHVKREKMTTHTASETDEAERLLAEDQTPFLERGDFVHGEPAARVPGPTSVRLSKPLLDAIDALATKQDRKRGNLIQHILWEYVRAQPEV